ncbi:hypothetical protein ABWU93_11260 [Xanthomonas translucens pv. translucens]|uniref:hypothetical protein n=1 Tax=Xanthomonas campestris pv. translucens TaxID=343 RepID=UPI003F715D64
MAVGFRVRNINSRSIQIGTDYKNHSLCKSFIAKPSDFSAGISNRWDDMYNLMEIDLGGIKSPVIAFKNVNGSYCGVVPVVRDGVNYIGGNKGQMNNPVTCYVFGENSVKSNISVGLRIIRRDHGIAYDSSIYALKVISAINIPSGKPDNSNLGFSLGAYGVNAAACIPAPRVGFRVPHAEMVYIDMDAIYQDSSLEFFVIRRQTVYRQDSSGRQRWKVGSFPGSNTSTVALIIDTSDLPVPFKL